MTIRIILILIFFSQSINAPSSYWRTKTLSISNDSALRKEIVDSIVYNLFWNTDELYGVSIYLKKSDFSDNAKKMLLRYFERSLRETDKERIKIEVEQIVERDIEKYKNEALTKDIPFELYYENVRKDLCQKYLSQTSIQTRNNVPPLYARILG